MRYALKVAGRVTLLTSLVPPEVLISGAANTIIYEQDNDIRAHLGLPQVLGPPDLSYQNLFRVLIVQFFDADSFDLRSIRKTCIHIAHPDAERLIPFDTFNLFYRDELEQQRMEALRRLAKPVSFSLNLNPRRADGSSVKSRTFWIILVLTFAAQCQSISTPVILNASETAGPGDIIYLQGAGFGNFPFVQYSHNDSNWTPLAIVNAGNGYASVQIPASDVQLPDLLTVRISADNSNNWSAPVFINRARGISFDTDEIVAGAQFRIFGRNLFLMQRPTVRFVDQADNSSSSAAVDILHSASYLLTVNAPSTIVAGHRYSVFISNGYSGNSASGGETLVAQTLLGRSGGTDYWNLGVSWASDLTAFSNSYNVKTDPRLTVHAVGDGSNDDTAALVYAVAAAGKAGGGTVYLPSGGYKLIFSNGCGLTLPANVVLAGAGQGTTVIYYGYGAAPQANQGGYAVCFGNQTGVSDLTLTNVNSSGQWPQSGLSVGSQKVFLQRVTWNLGTSQWITLSQARDVTIQNSTITQGANSSYLGPLALQGCSRCQLKSNTIQFVLGGMLFDYATDTVFENNTVTRDISAAPPGASVTHSFSASFTTNLTLLNNVFTSVGNALPTNNDGEVVSSEAGGPVRTDEFRGTVSASNSLTITDSAQNFFQSGNLYPALRAGVATVAIVSGNGMGQVRTVVAVSSDGKTLTVDRPWDVAVDAGSNYATFDWSASNWLLANNTMTGNFKGIEIFNASASDILIQSNVLTDSDGIMISPTQQPPGLFNVVRGLSILDNTVSDLAGLRPSYIGITPREDSQTYSFGTAVLGATVKNNIVTGFVPNVVVNVLSWDDFKVMSEGFLNFWFWQTTTAYSPANAPPPILGTIFQYNRAYNSKDAFVLNTGAAQTVIQDFVPVNVGQTLLDQLITGSQEASQGTVVQGQATFLPLLTTGGKAPIVIQVHPKTPQK